MTLLRVIRYHTLRDIGATRLCGRLVRGCQAVQLLCIGNQLAWGGNHGK